MGSALTLFAVMMAIMGPIIIIVFISEYFKYKKATNARIATLNKEVAENSTEDLEKEVEQLKERIQVLESIVTDGRYDLDRKIANL